VPDPTDASRDNRADRALVLLAVAIALYLFWRSLSWPLIHDAALMHYIAWLIAHGAVPYRDTFDMNLPGAYLIHLVVLVIGGPGDQAWRVFERGWLAATALCAYRYCRPLAGRRGATLAALLFAIHHLGDGASVAGQRDFFLCLFLLAGAYAVARSTERGGATSPLLLAGLVAGFAVIVKPLAALFLVALASAAALGRCRTGRSPLAGAAAVAGAGLVAPLPIFGWLAWIGGLRDFFLILTRWTLPFYSQVGIRSSWHVLVSLYWVLLAGTAALGAVSRVPAPFAMRRALALVGVVYGMLHFGTQAKGYDYHLYPLTLFLCVLVGVALAPVGRDAAADQVGLRRYARTAATALAALIIVVLAGRGYERLNQPWEAQRIERVDAVVRDLRRVLRPGETIQVLGPPGGHVLLRLGLQQPTRFFTDFQFYVWTEDPRIQALRAEFMAGLDAHPPAAIVAFPGRGGEGPYGRLAQFPALDELLARRYAIAVEGNGYRIYTRLEPARPSERSRGPSRDAGSELGDDEEPAKGEQRLAVGARGIGGPHALAVCRFERGALPGRERLEEGREPRALHPFDDRIVSVEHLQVHRLPDVDRARVRHEQIAVELAGLGGLGPDQPLEPIAPPGLPRRLVDRRVRGLGEVAGHLDGEDAAAGDHRRQPREQSIVPVEPLERGVGKEQADGCPGLPRPEVGELPVDVGGGPAGAPEHRLRRVDARDGGGGPALAQRARDVAGPAAEIGDVLDPLERDALDQVERGPQPMVAVGEVPGGIPGHPRTSSRTTPRRSISNSSPWIGGRLGNQRTPWMAAAPAGPRMSSTRKPWIDAAV